MNMKNPFKIAFWLLIASVILAILHNAFYAVFGFEEGVFFILTFVSLLGFIGFFIYGLIRKLF